MRPSRGQRDARRRQEIAPGVVGEEGFRAVVGPFHRPADALRRPQDRRLLGIEIVAQPEAAADVGADEMDFLVGHAEAFCQHAARHVDALVAGNQLVGVARRIVGGDAGARLHLGVDDALIAERLFDHEIGRGKCDFHRRRHRRTPGRARRCRRRMTARSALRRSLCARRSQREAPGTRPRSPRRHLCAPTMLSAITIATHSPG